ncbi:MAG: hypothetical protein WCS80_00350 [Bacilli bacterium]
MKKNFVLCMLGFGTVISLASCGASNNKFSTPTDFTFDSSTGKFHFSTVENAEYYQVTMMRRINEDTYNALKANDRSAKQATSLEIKKDETWYLWNENVTSATRLADKRSKGYIEDNFNLRTYSNSATSAGSPVEFSTLAVGDYVLQTIALEDDTHSASDPNIYTFTKEGDLANPSDFTFNVNDDKKIEITAGSNYYYNCLTSTGLPYAMEFSIKDSQGAEKEKLNLTDLSWTNSIQGPTNSFTFNNSKVTSKNSYTASDIEDFTVSVSAVGNGSNIKTATGNANYEYDFEIPNFTFNATKEESVYTGPATLNIAATIDGVSRPLTCQSGTKENSDFYYTVKDSKEKITGTLDMKVVKSQGWGGETTTLKATLTLNDTALSGTYTIGETANEDGSYTVSVKDIKASTGGFPGGPMFAVTHDFFPSFER